MRRLTIGRMMIAVGVAALLLAIYRADGQRAFSLLTAILMISCIVFGTFLGGPRPSAWCFAGSACLGNFACFLGSLAMMIAGLFLASFFVVPFILGSGAAWAVGRPEGRRPSRRVAWSIVLAAGLSPVLMLATHWPFQVPFAISRPALERLADRVAAGESIAFPVQAGFFEVVAAIPGPAPGEAALILDNDPAGRVGLVRFVGPRGSFWPLSNLNFNIPIAGTWRFQVEN